LMVMAQPVSQLLAIVWGSLMEGRRKNGFILWLGGGGRLLLLPVALAGTAIAFSIPVIASIAMATAIIPALNALYQSNYTDVERGRVYGWVLSVTAAATILGAMGAGALMDVHPSAVRVIYPVAGILGGVSAFLYFRIRARGGVARGAEARGEVARDATAHGALATAAGATIAPSPSAPLVARAAPEWRGDLLRAVRNPFRGSIEIFRADPSFFRFEMAYMVYGLAYMIVQPVIPIFLVDEIRVQYSQAAIARGLIFWGLISLASPAFGRVLDRWNAVRVSLIGFAVLALFPLALAASRSVPGVYAAFGIYGLAMSAVSIAWTMGPILFAKERDAATYMGVHVTMVGIRGLVGNPLGLVLLQTVGSRAAFFVASGLFVAAAVMMLRLDRAART